MILNIVCPFCERKHPVPMDFDDVYTCDCGACYRICSSNLLENGLTLIAKEVWETDYLPLPEELRKRFHDRRLRERKLSHRQTIEISRGSIVIDNRLQYSPAIGRPGFCHSRPYAAGNREAHAEQITDGMDSYAACRLHPGRLPCATKPPTSATTTSTRSGRTISPPNRHFLVPGTKK